MNTNTNRNRLFVTADGKNVMFTFMLVSSLFLLWGVCNGMIDVMDKHFQDELSLTWPSRRRCNGPTIWATF